MSFQEPVTITIPSGAPGLSGAVEVGVSKYMAIVMPGTWVAAVLTFQGSHDGGNTYTNVSTSTGELTFATSAAVADVMLPLPMETIGAYSYIKVRSGTAASPVNQTAERTLYLARK